MRRLIARGIFLIALLTSHSAFAQFMYETFEYPDAIETRFVGINDQGEILGTYQLVNDGEVTPFILDRGEIIELTIPENCNNRPIFFAINSAREISLSFFDGGGFSACIVRGDVGTVYGDVVQFAGLNDRGQAVGQEDRGAVMLTRKGEVVAVRVPPGTIRSTAMDINDKGQIVGFFQPDEDSLIRGFLVSRKKTTVITFPDDPDVTQGSVNPVFINNRGAIIIVSEAGFFSLYRKGKFTPIEPPAGVVNNDWDITGFNDTGQIVGWYFNGEGTTAFIGTPQGKGKRKRHEQVRLIGILELRSRVAAYNDDMQSWLA